MNNTIKKLALSQETLRNITQNQDELLAYTTMPWCPTGFNATAGNNDMR
jgi:hypothetical protein